ncbi:Lipase/Acylhydrolase with GDSL-like motif [Pediococcus damnosus]|uniref:Lipase/Acylhydrolase with GDSL-like motif n=1 Tax=Pediococcus damnosus TaxID=51663 RepID=A0A0R2HMV2_9LACO|nr:SGNH/GDSL hydrolase family protein [Pediococcus damnosus]AMV61544.1 Lipase/Acylhydrolase with GDSL-like motif [Pediococcus damnosus]AMV62091.1 Lipase/Acylhydrolase with GDSL-like motif [Pediococcus damnosus]AMV65907.1 Lipase/Acylhydrolase with GDSL-like motif [Pediococcus damnosus]AMV68058.1 Lipase/Acylhydrolase with GDSL-like motif [Pediococcus damnosus]AMV70242.1 Lipase/Acylhydrolase with GDSL-like motif [Pediococcus damnosus]
MKKITDWVIMLIVFVVIIALVVLGLNYYFPTHSTPDQSSKTTHIVHKATKTKKKHIRITALGDSLTQGVGDSKNEGGYTKRLQKKIKSNYNVKTKVANYGVSGERSDQILKRVKQDSKLQKSIKNSDAITITVGGNDLFQALQKYSTASSGEFTLSLEKLNIKYATHVQDLLKQVRKYNSNAPIYVVGIYNPFFVYFPNITQINKAITNFDETTQAAVSQTKSAYFISVNKLLSRGQYQSAKSLSELKQSSTAKSIDDMQISKVEKNLENTKEKNIYISSSDHFHPNPTGYDQMTRLLLRSLHTHDQWLYEE